MRHAKDIDYRHLVAALQRKPGAFARWVLRDAAFPREVYKRTWERLAARVPEREACRTMVGLLVLAADGHEAQLADELDQLIELDHLPDLFALTLLLAPPRHRPRALQAAPLPSAGVSSRTQAITSSRRSRRACTPTGRQVFFGHR